VCKFARGALGDFSEGPVELEWLFVSMSAVELHCRSLDLNIMTCFFRFGSVPIHARCLRRFFGGSS
jgi:hypothetical protein